MVPFSASTCRNFGVLENAHTSKVQLEFQSAWYSAPISNAWDLNVPRSGLINPDSTNTTPSYKYPTYGQKKYQKETIVRYKV